MCSFKYSICMVLCTIYIPSFCIIQDFIKSTISITQNHIDYDNSIFMILYKGSTLEKAKMYTFPLSEIASFKKHMDFNEPVILYIHGFIEHFENESVRTVVSAYLENTNFNVLVLDWSALNFENYALLTKRMRPIANSTGKALEVLVDVGMDSEDLHVVSHSMGCQIAAFIGEYVNFTIPRITALDAAGPLFYQFNAEHLTNQSARQVVAIHTDGGMLGALPQTGTIDIYANGGIRPQPGCELQGIQMGLCSHQRSWRFYSESLAHKKNFPALKCSSYISFMRNKCRGNHVIYFGAEQIPDRSGTYYFQTNKKAPYGRKHRGINMSSTRSFITRLLD